MRLPSYVVVIPTIGRPCLQDCLNALAGAVTAADGASAAGLAQVVVADDRRGARVPLPVQVPRELASRVVEVTVEGRGPAAARNAGWRAAMPAEWVVFIDDDVQVSPEWAADLGADLAAAPPHAGGVQGVVEVPWPEPGLAGDHKPTDSQRATIGLAGAPWITADMAYRRAALADAGGFDERFPRAYREDSDLALRVMDLGWSLRRGQRRSAHPVRPPSSWASIAAQAGNADDAAMLRQHGRGWRRRAGAGTGRRAAHAGACALGACALLLGPWRATRPLALACAAGWLAMTSELAARRIQAGPRTAGEMGAMLVTSAVIPPLAVGHWLAGWRRNRNAAPWPPRPRAVLFDRDGTLVHDVPYNADPALVAPLPGAAEAVAALRDAGLRVGVVTNQSGVAAGKITAGQLAAVNARVQELLGPFGTWQACTHLASDGCTCRKPAPGLVMAAAEDLGVSPAECVVIGDIATDVAAARAAGARGILVPAPATQPADQVGVPVAGSLAEAVQAVLAGRRLPSWRRAGVSPARRQGTQSRGEASWAAGR